MVLKQLNNGLWTVVHCSRTSLINGTYGKPINSLKNYPNGVSKAKALSIHRAIEASKRRNR